MARKLASIQLIKDIQPIPNADAIVVATVLGWKVVVGKDEFKIGDKVVFCEIDSLFPRTPSYDFLERVNYKIKTIKLRGQISQGLCLDLSYLPKDRDYQVGDDVTTLLCITKYELPNSFDSKFKAPYPGFISKTDETRVQTLQDFLDENAGTECFYTEKLEGDSTTFYYRNKDFGACSRNNEYDISDIAENKTNLMNKILKKYEIEEKLKYYGKNIAIQGETIGDRIQGNVYDFKKNEFGLYIFSVFDIDTYSYLDLVSFEKIMNILKIPTVPILERKFILHNDIDKLVEMSIGQSMINPKKRREGIVIRGVDNTNDLSFKVINPEYLLKQK